MGDSSDEEPPLPGLPPSSQGSIQQAALKNHWNMIDIELNSTISIMLQVFYCAVAATDLRFQESRKIFKLYKVDNFGGSRGHTHKILKKYKIEDAGGSWTNTNKYSRRQAHGVKNTDLASMIWHYPRSG